MNYKNDLKTKNEVLTNENGDILPAIIKGDGSPLIFLHGFMSSKEAFLSQIDYFSKKFKVYAPDLTGFGENSFMPYPYSLKDYLNDFLRLAAQTQSEKVSVIAHSFGCRITLKALCETNVIKQAVLVGAAGLKTKKSARYYFKRAGYKLLKPFLTKDALEKRFFSVDYNLLDDVKKCSFKLVTSELFDEKLKKISVPVLAVFGENDAETPTYLADRIEKNVLGAQKYIMKGCGHFCFVEKPNEFNFVVNEFLNR